MNYIAFCSNDEPICFQEGLEMVKRLYKSKLTRRFKARPSEQIYLRHPNNFNNELDRDIAAMKKVWEMLLEGSIRWFGEVGRQY